VSGAGKAPAIQEMEALFQAGIELVPPVRFQRAAFPAPFAFFGATVALFCREAWLATASQLDVPDDLRLRGVVHACLESKIKCQLMQLLNGHISPPGKLGDEKRHLV